MSQLAIVVEVDRCIGCKGGCQIACKTEHNIALGRSRSTLYTMGPTGTFPDLEMYYLPVMCQQCKDPACTKVCPTSACMKNDEDGVVTIDPDVCIGCRACMNACPFHCNSYNQEMRIMDKCTLCAERREEAPAVHSTLATSMTRTAKYPVCLQKTKDMSIRCRIVLAISLPAASF